MSGLDQAGFPAPMMAEDGASVFTALVRIRPNGKLVVCILASPDPDPDGDDDIWIVEEFDGPDVDDLATALQVHALPRGTA